MAIIDKKWQKLLKYAMQTVNISLPKSLAVKLDSVIESEGYASRSEFIRALIRSYTSNKSLNSQLKLKPFKKAPLKTIEAEMRSTGKYSEKFIKSVIKGFSESSVYAKS